MKRIYLFATAALMFAACSSDDLSLNNEQQVADIDDGAVRFDAYQQRGITRSGLIGDLDLANLKETAAKFGGFGVFGFYTDNKDYDQLATPNFMYNQQVIWNKTVSNNTWQYDPLKYWPNEYGSNAQSDDADRVSFFAYAPFVNVTPSTGKTTAPSDAQKDAYQDALTAYNTAFDTYKTARETYEGVLLEYANTGDASAVSAAKDVYNNAYNDDYKPELEAWQAAQKAWYAAGGGDLGITGMTRNTASGDPIVKYIGSFSSTKAVDLCWGVCEQSDWAKVQDGQTQQFTLGKPWLDVQRPASTAQRLKFQFKHALAKMQIKVDEFKDEYKLNGNMPAETRIWIRSVRFKGFTMKGALNLNNETAGKPYWMNYNGIGDLEADDEVVVYDGRKDGKEGVGGSIATNEKTLGLNPQFVENEEAYIYGSTKSIWSDVNEHLGVTATPTDLFEDGGIFYVIPTDDGMEVEIVYDVETIVPGLGVTLSDGKTAGSSIENRISKTIKFGADDNKLEAGKAYAINLHLGMNSVKFDATVTGWEDMVDPDIDLPANMPSYAFDNASASIDIPGADTEFYFAVTGLKGGESVTGATCGADNFTSATVDVSSTGDFSAADSHANASGVAYVHVNLVTKNFQILDVTTANAIVITPAQSSEFKLAVTQKAQPLALQAPTGAPNDIPSAVSYQLGSSLTGRTLSTDISNWQVPATGGTPAASIQVWCDGAKLTPGTVSASVTTDAASEDQFNFNTSTGTIYFASARTAGQTIKVTIKAGDVPEETITFKVAKLLAFVPSTVELPWVSAKVYDVSGYLKYTTGGITWKKDGTSIPNGTAVSITDLGSYTITATDDMNTTGPGETGDDKEATLNLTIGKQPFELDGWTSAVNADNKLTTDFDGSSVQVYDLDITTHGSIDLSATGNVTYSFTTAVKVEDESIHTFSVDADGKVTTSGTLSSGTYKITVSVTGTPDDATHYSAVNESVVITLVVT